MESEMELYLRQIALVANGLEPAMGQLNAMFGTPVCYRDDGVAKFGLENALSAIGSQFIEIVAPTEEGTAAGRYLDRRKGDGGYMVILQCPDRDTQNACEQNAADNDIRIAWQREEGKGRIMQLHPADTGGTFFEIDHVHPFEPEGLWPPAGGNGWQSQININVATGITAAEIQSPKPQELAERWSAIVGIPLEKSLTAYVLPLTNGEIRFVSALDSRGEGLSAIDIKVIRKTKAIFSARAAGLKTTDDQVTWCGLHINLV
ncbi:MAG: hypothetical protein E2O92_09315 [Alphaproteobacteria bacterium]|nr:MAG: hypothetical protein E2O92_09315 [Alphaproteobacteria bacterium]